MHNDWQHIFWLSAAFMALFGLAEFLYRVAKVKAEISRKFVHLVTGVLTLLFPVFLQSHWSVLLLCASFALILVLSLKFGWLPSINAIDRKSSGSLLYPLSVYLVFLFYSSRGHHLLYFYLPVLTLAICDPVAALLGKRFPYGKFKVGCGHKTLTGCVSFLVTSFALTLFLFLQWGDNLLQPRDFFPAAASVALCSTMAEAFSGRGWDNLSIPLSVMLILFEV